MEFGYTIPFDEAVRRIDRRTPVASTLDTAEWKKVPLALRERAMFSATVNNLRAMEAIKTKLREAVSEVKTRDDTPFMDRQRFTKEMREVLQAHGLDDGSERLTNPASVKRLGLIYDFQLEDAYSYGRWKTGQSAGALYTYPAQELIRVESRVNVRNWRQRWVAAGGKLYGGRMVARKDDPVWTAISRFGRPWPPFDFGSGMGIQDIDREEAVALSVMSDDDNVSPQEEDFNKEVEMSAMGLSPEAIKSLQDSFGDQIVVTSGKAQWKPAGPLVADTFTKVIGAADLAGSLNLGLASERIINLYELKPSTTKLVKFTNLRHIHDRHGVGNEKLSDQVEVDRTHVSFIPTILDDPDEVRDAEPSPTGEKRKLHILRVPSIGEMQMIVEITADKLSAISMWIKKER